MATLLDIVPTILDWFNIKYPKYSIFRHKPPVSLTGTTLLPLTLKNLNEEYSDRDHVYASQSLHEITMYYPMRSVRTKSYKLLHNLNYRMPFPIDQDFYLSPTFQDILNRTKQALEIPWYKNLTQYYYRPQWELFSLETDPKELTNLYGQAKYANIIMDLKLRLNNWQNITQDPWICAPEGVLEDAGKYKNNPQCMPLYNEL